MLGSKGPGDGLQEADSSYLTSASSAPFFSSPQLSFYFILFHFIALAESPPLFGETV